MGYTTDFKGEFRITPALTPEHAAYLKKFSETRRMNRDEVKASLLPDPIREAAGLPVGPNGRYFVGGTGLLGQDNDPSVLDYHSPPGIPSMNHTGNFSDDWAKFTDAKVKALIAGAQPGPWCRCVPNAEGTALFWDGCEMFYVYVEWLEYLIKHFLRPWGYTLNGEVEWDGESDDDWGTIYVENNRVQALEGELPCPDWDED